MSAAAPPFTFTNDKFALLLNMRCSVWKKSITSTTSYGQPIEQYIKLADEIPCYAEQQTGKELNVPPETSSETSLGIETWVVFMRPLFVNDPEVSPNPVRLNNHYWLQVKKPGADTIDANDPSVVLFDITGVDDPGLIGHHFEVAATVTRP